MRIQISPVRLRRMLEQVGGCGRDARGGYTRLAFSREEAAARALVAEWLAEVGFRVCTDAAGNLIARRDGALPGPALAVGSHLDSVPQGGLFDGALGVVAAVECALTLAERGRSLRHPLEIISFADEEGTCLGGTFGSRALAGMISPQDMETTDHHGATLAERVARVGLDPAALPSARRRPEEFRAFLELHVEQGPVLDRLGIPVGVVNRVVGYRRFSVTLRGQANHAGTTPMAERRDALMAAASLLVGLRDEVLAEAATGEGTVLTVGSMQVEPGVHNVIPSRVVFPVEVRDGREAYLESFESLLRARLAGLGLPHRIERFARKKPVPMADAVQRAIRGAAEQMGVPHHTLASGAGHDAMCMANLTPTGMIFVSSRGGLSHCPEEHTDWDVAALGAELLLLTLLRLDRAEEPPSPR